MAQELLSEFCNQAFAVKCTDHCKNLWRYIGRRMSNRVQLCPPVECGNSSMVVGAQFSKPEIDLSSGACAFSMFYLNICDLYRVREVSYCYADEGGAVHMLKIVLFQKHFMPLFSKPIWTWNLEHSMVHVTMMELLFYPVVNHPSLLYYSTSKRCYNQNLVVQPAENTPGSDDHIEWSIEDVQTQFLRAFVLFEQFHHVKALLGVAGAAVSPPY